MKTALITGASRGIGLATTRKFLSEGWFVIGTSTSGKIPIDSSNVKVVTLDYLKPQSVSAAVADIEALGKKIDVLINNAGTAEEEILEHINIKALRKTLEVNLIGPIDFTDQLLDLFNSLAHVISISSRAGVLSEVELDWVVPAYKMSKVAVNMYTRVMAQQWRGRNITVSSLDPGWVKTDMGGANALRKPEEPAEEIYALANASVETGQFWLNGKKRSW